MGRGQRRLVFLAALVVSMLAFASQCLAARSPATNEPESPTTAACVVHSLPSFTAQGEFGTASSIADVVEVECEPQFSGAKVRLSSEQLYSRCNHDLTWSAPYGSASVSESPSYQVTLDDDGGATAVLWGGPSCAAGESLISASLEEAPYETVTTSFAVQAPPPSATGVRALPSSEVEDDVYSSVGAIFEVEFPSVYAGRYVNINAAQLYDRCLVAPHLLWYGADHALIGEGEEVSKLKLDNDGSVFVVVLGAASCASGESLIEASLEQTPYTTVTTTFTILPPEPTWEQPSFTIEKLQQISGGGYTTSPLKGKIGQAVEYEIRVKNTGNITENLSPLTDAHCGSVSGGASTLAAGESTTFLCQHVLTEVGTYTNEAAITGTPPGGTPVTHPSNRVEVEVPAEPELTIAKLQKIAGSSTGFTTERLTGALGQTVDYQIVVTNSGNVPLALSEFRDEHCDPGTLAGGPTEALAPEASVTYTCSHLLTTPGSLINEASVEGRPEAGRPIEKTSNPVEVVTLKGHGYYTIEKLQRLSEGEAFTTAPLTGSMGETVQYEIIVTNTGEESLTFGELSDAHCDIGTIAGGPGATPLTPGHSATYTCSHLLTEVGTYVNEASVTATAEGQEPLTLGSNRVEVEVPPPTPITIVTPAPTPQAKQGVLAICETSEPVLNGAYGPKRDPFKVQVRAIGIKQITFYLDGRKLKTLKESQARHDMFTLVVDPRKLRTGAHRISIKTVMSNPVCKPTARSSVFVRPSSAKRRPSFTG
jgi:hypothetical protein